MRNNIQKTLLLICMCHSLSLLAQAETGPKVSKNEQCRLYGLYQLSTGDWQACNPEDFDLEPENISEEAPKEELEDEHYLPLRNTLR